MKKRTTEAIYSVKHLASILNKRKLNMEKHVVVRFEEDFAVLEKENGEIINAPKVLVKAKENDVVIFLNGEYIKNEEETKKRKLLIKEKMKKVFKN